MADMESSVEKLQNVMQGIMVKAFAKITSKHKNGKDNCRTTLKARSKMITLQEKKQVQLPEAVSESIEMEEDQVYEREGKPIGFELSFEEQVRISSEMMDRKLLSRMNMCTNFEIDGIIYLNDTKLKTTRQPDWIGMSANEMQEYYLC